MIRYIINTNLMGYIRVAYAFLEHLEQNKSGYIVNVSSIQAVGYAADLLNAAYITVKGGIISFSTCLHACLKGKGIKVSCLIPGAVRTELQKNTRYVGTPEKVQQMISNFEAFARLPVFLSPEEEAAGLIKGMKKEEFFIFVPESMKAMLKAQAWDIDAYNV